MSKVYATPTKKFLYEISIIRPLVIFLLVLLHSFQKIQSGGGYHNDYQLIGVYKWFTYFISGFRIETIAFVAGYVFSYQSHDLGRSYNFKPFVWKKFKRLIIPMVVFGLIYYFLFFFHVETFSLMDFLLKLFSGCGHLWFLPMLFWCFIAIWIIDHYRFLNKWWLLLILAVISVLPRLGLPLGFARLPHFVFYVYGGYFLWTKRDLLFNNLTWKKIIVLWLAYVALVIISHTIIPSTSPTMSFIRKLEIVILENTVELVMAVCGIMALYMTTCRFTTKEGFKPKPWIITASEDCYGVYVYHQFILVWLYFFTPLVITIHPLIVPWIGFVVTLLLSLLLTKLTLKTKLGRFLIG